MYTPQSFPVYVRTGWIDFSPALHAYVTRSVIGTLSPFASRIRSVTVRVADHEPHDSATRLCAIDVEVKPVGALLAVSTGRDVYQLIDQAANEVLEKLRAHSEAEGWEPLSRIA
jgi:hypothetical protein